MPKNKGKYRSQQPKQAAPEEQLKSWTQHALDFVRPHALKLVSVAAGLVVVLAGFSVWSYVVHKKQTAATKQFGEVVRAASTPVEGEVDPEAFLRGQTDPNAKKFKNFQERAEAALAQASALQAKYGTTDAGAQALLVQGGLAYDLGKYDDAITAYKGYLDRGPKVPDLAELAREGIGYAWEAKALAEKDDAAKNGDLASALKAYQAIESAEPGDKGPFVATAIYHEARVTALMGDLKGAHALYKKALEKHPAAPLRQQINERMGALTAAHPELKEAAAPASQPAAPASQPAAPAP